MLLTHFLLTHRETAKSSSLVFLRNTIPVKSPEKSEVRGQIWDLGAEVLLVGSRAERTPVVPKPLSLADLLAPSPPLSHEDEDASCSSSSHGTRCIPSFMFTRRDDEAAPKKGLNTTTCPNAVPSDTGKRTVSVDLGAPAEAPTHARLNGYGMAGEGRAVTLDAESAERHTFFPPVGGILDPITQWAHMCVV
ncbi:hypothetical protein EYF80_051104 [Liparis tanakae]|uniref:Uncharacterized protein n=1 Tax=Liparis tanakae TaxID=230148 RepID=A0A4Z2FC07_9TELE|nr:hypothetical protein EYF80_051104 [Liparis tanakae]